MDWKKSKLLPFEYGDLQTETENRLIKRGFNRPRITHSMFMDDPNGTVYSRKDAWAVVAPDFDQVAIKGNVKFTTYDGGTSRLYIDPTYEDILVAAQELIFMNDLHDHIFVEGAHFEEYGDDYEL